MQHSINKLAESITDYTTAYRERTAVLAQSHIELEAAVTNVTVAMDGIQTLGELFKDEKFIDSSTNPPPGVKTRAKKVTTPVVEEKPADTPEPVEEEPNLAVETVKSMMAEPATETVAHTTEDLRQLFVATKERLGSPEKLRTVLAKYNVTAVGDVPADQIADVWAEVSAL